MQARPNILFALADDASPFSAYRYRFVDTPAFDRVAREGIRFNYVFTTNLKTQLFACLVLKVFFNTDYRGIVAYLDDLPALQQTIGLDRVPHFTTLQKASARLLDDEDDVLIKDLLTHTLYAFFSDPPEYDAPPKPHPAYVFYEVAADSTGFEAGRCSRYFVKRRREMTLKTWQETSYKRFAKLGVIADCETHLILATCRGVGPRPDVDELYPLLEGFCHNAAPEVLMADAGYDSEHNHGQLRDCLGIDSLIPAKAGRPSERLPTGRYRFEMATRFDEENYRKRWQVETVMSMLKNNLGDAVAARTESTWSDELALKTVTHNILLAYAT
jgi:hypothetical protein